jgi:hypothetical protein
MNDYQIKYKNINTGKHFYKFNINKSFFSLFDTSEITDAEIEANVILDKKGHKDILNIEISGNINNLLCDSCSSKLSLPISSKTSFLIEFTDENKTSLDDIIYVKNNTNKLCVKEILFEMIILSVPNKRKCAVKEDGKNNCDPEMLKLIEKYSTKEKILDDRWQELKKINLKVT